MAQREAEAAHQLSVAAAAWTIEYNEIASNKWGVEFAPDFTIRNNYIHHNLGNSSSSIAAERISFESSIGATIRSDTVRRNASESVTQLKALDFRGSQSCARKFYASFCSR